MTGLADLQTHEPGPPGPPRRRLPRPVGITIVLVVVLALVAGIFVGGRAVLTSLRGGSPDYRGEGTGEVVVQVHTGDSAADIGTTLQAKDVVKSVGAFRKAAAQDDRSRSVQPGFYLLRARMSGAAALGRLLDPAARSRSRVTLPEGVTLAQALEKIAQATEVPMADLQKAVDEPAALGLPAYAKGQVEGLLFPATYDVEPGSTAVQALKQMLDRFQQAAADVDLERRAAALGRTPYDVLVTASLIERETAFPEDRPRVARVVYNRLAMDKPLEFDSTVNYLREQKKARLTLDDLKVESDYNTYLRKGLPPTPIDSPGEAALEAALNPEDGNYLYFVTVSKDGSALFTADYNAFLTAKAKAKADGIY